MSKFFSDDTIAAVATPAGTGAISVIRVSGDDAFKIIDKYFAGRKKISESATHTIHYGKIITDRGVAIDDVLISVFRKPNSYTGEDSIEISTHGSPLITQKILEQLVSGGARLAEPGEFTKRAFLNNKLDLPQAEAVADVIASRTEASLRGARNQLDGLLSQKVQFLRSELLNLSSLVELELDFSEEDIELIDRRDLLRKLENIINEIEGLLSTYSFGRIIRDGVHVALVGKPNVGKSSLLNYILKEHRAIVSHIPGTTRDIIREDVSIDGVLFKLYDTAGIRISRDEIEKEGVLRSRDAVTKSDIVVFMNDVEQEIDQALLEEIKSIKDEDKILTVLNKIDLSENRETGADVYISAKTGEGIDELFSKMKAMAFRSANYSEKSAVISNLRHYNCLKNAVGHLQKAISSAENNMSGEFIAIDLRTAESSLGEIIGEVTSKDILNNIFANFCIGK